METPGFESQAPIAEPKKSKTGIIIAVVAIVLCCCCLVVLIGGWFGGDAIIKALGM
jgi:phosphate/sulfate permease